MSTFIVNKQLQSKLTADFVIECKQTADFVIECKQTADFVT